MGSAVSSSTPSKSHVVDSDKHQTSDKPQTDIIQPVQMEEKENISQATALPDKTGRINAQNVQKVSEKEIAANGKNGEELSKDKGTEKKVTEEPKQDAEKEQLMTQEELKEFRDNTLDILRTSVSDILSLKSLRNETGEYDDKVVDVCTRLHSMYSSLKRTSLDEIEKFRIAISHVIVETKLLDIICEIVIHTFKDDWMEGKDGLFKKRNALNYALLNVFNYSDASDELAIAAASKPGFLEIIKEIIVDYRERYLGHVDPKLQDAEEKLVRYSLSIVHNMSMRESNVKRLRDCSMIEVLKPYLQSTNEMYSLNVLASLSGIINEEESEIINSNKDIVLFLLDILRQAMKHNRRRHRGWSAKESGFTVRMLARNDANKKLLVDLGALELLVELGRTGSLVEQHESVQAIWALAFDKDNAALITGKTDLGVVDLLVDLKHTDNDAIKKACNGALWTLRDALKNTVVVKYKEIGDSLSAESLDRKSSTVVKSTGHVMISYQWADQKVLKNVRDRIRANGYKVWMDIDQMGGSTLQAMADAVEGADVFLMCMSNKYKNSPSCRAEAEYAYQLRKKIIPLKMERGYTPDGWLGFILGAKLFFEFSDKYPFEQKIPSLLKEIDNLLMRKGVDEAGSHQAEVEIKPEKTVMAYAAGTHVVDYPNSSSIDNNHNLSRIPVSMATLKKVRKWSQKEVKDWIDSKGLKGCGVDNITGDEIALLADMRVGCQELFYKCLQDMLKVKNLLTLAKLYWALQELSEHA